MKGRLVIFAVLLIGSACGNEGTIATISITQVTTEPTASSSTVSGFEECSASGMPGAVAEQPELPVPVALTRVELVAAATACDYETLDFKATFADDFMYSFGEVGDPLTYWQDLENRGEPVLATLVELLSTPPTRSGEVEVDLPTSGPTMMALWVWPTAFATDDPTDADWAHLADIYSTDEIEQFKEFGYLGYRVGIREDGAWQFYVAGD